MKKNHTHSCNAQQRLFTVPTSGVTVFCAAVAKPPRPHNGRTVPTSGVSYAAVAKPLIKRIFCVYYVPVAKPLSCHTHLRRVLPARAGCHRNSTHLRRTFFSFRL